VHVISLIEGLNGWGSLVGSKHISLSNGGEGSAGGGVHDQ
jgi:hypothetical protein